MKFLGEQEGDVGLSDLRGGRCGYWSQHRGLLVLCDAHLLLVTALFHPPFISSHTQPFRSSTHSQQTQGQTPRLQFVRAHAYVYLNGLSWAKTPLGDLAAEQPSV